MPNRFDPYTLKYQNPYMTDDEKKAKLAELKAETTAFKNGKMTFDEIAANHRTPEYKNMILNGGGPSLPDPTANSKYPSGDTNSGKPYNTIYNPDMTLKGDYVGHPWWARMDTSLQNTLGGDEAIAADLGSSFKNYSADIVGGMLGFAPGALTGGTPKTLYGLSQKLASKALNPVEKALLPKLPQVSNGAINVGNAVAREGLAGVGYEAGMEGLRSNILGADSQEDSGYDFSLQDAGKAALSNAAFEALTHGMIKGVDLGNQKIAQPVKNYINKPGWESIGKVSGVGERPPEMDFSEMPTSPMGPTEVTEIPFWMSNAVERAKRQYDAEQAFGQVTPDIPRPERQSQLDEAFKGYIPPEEIKINPEPVLDPRAQRQRALNEMLGPIAQREAASPKLPTPQIQEIPFSISNAIEKAKRQYSADQTLGPVAEKQVTRDSRQADLEAAFPNTPIPGRSFEQENLPEWLKGSLRRGIKQYDLEKTFGANEAPAPRNPEPPKPPEPPIIPPGLQKGLSQPRNINLNRVIAPPQIGGPQSPLKGYIQKAPKIDPERAQEVKNMDAALERMKKKGHDTTEFQRKRDAIAAGAPYKKTDVTADLIGGVAAQIPRVNMGFKDGETVPPKGSFEVTPEAQKVVDTIHNTVNKELGHESPITKDIPQLPRPKSGEPKAEPQNEAIIIKRGNNTFEVYKNPTDKQYFALVDKFKEEYPRAPVGEPKVRRTYDAQGNEYIWMAGDAMHIDVESYLKNTRGIEANQNKSMLEPGSEFTSSSKPKAEPPRPKPEEQLKPLPKQPKEGEITDSDIRQAKGWSDAYDRQAKELENEVKTKSYQRYQELMDEAGVPWNKTHGQYSEASKYDKIKDRINKQLDEEFAKDEVEIKRLKSEAQKELHRAIEMAEKFEEAKRNKYKPVEEPPKPKVEAPKPEPKAEVKLPSPTPAKQPKQPKAEGQGIDGQDGFTKEEIEHAITKVIDITDWQKFREDGSFKHIKESYRGTASGGVWVDVQRKGIRLKTDNHGETLIPYAKVAKFLRGVDPLDYHPTWKLRKYSAERMDVAEAISRREKPMQEEYPVGSKRNIKLFSYGKVDVEIVGHDGDKIQYKTSDGKTWTMTRNAMDEKSVVERPLDKYSRDFTSGHISAVDSLATEAYFKSKDGKYIVYTKDSKNNWWEYHYSSHSGEEKAIELEGKPNLEGTTKIEGDSALRSDAATGVWRRIPVEEHKRLTEEFQNKIDQAKPKASEKPKVEMPSPKPIEKPKAEVKLPNPKPSVFKVGDDIGAMFKNENSPHGYNNAEYWQVEKIENGKIHLAKFVDSEKYRKIVGEDELQEAVQKFKDVRESSKTTTPKKKEPEIAPKEEKSYPKAGTKPLDKMSEKELSDEIKSLGKAVGYTENSIKMAFSQLEKARKEGGDGKALEMLQNTLKTLRGKVNEKEKSFWSSIKKHFYFSESNFTDKEFDKLSLKAFQEAIRNGELDLKELRAFKSELADEALARLGIKEQYEPTEYDLKIRELAKEVSLIAEKPPKPKQNAFNPDGWGRAKYKDKLGWTDTHMLDLDESIPWNNVKMNERFKDNTLDGEKVIPKDIGNVVEPLGVKIDGKSEYVIFKNSEGKYSVMNKIYYDYFRHKYGDVIAYQKGPYDSVVFKSEKTGDMLGLALPIRGDKIDFKAFEAKIEELRDVTSNGGYAPPGTKVSRSVAPKVENQYTGVHEKRTSMEIKETGTDEPAVSLKGIRKLIEESFIPVRSGRFKSDIPDGTILGIFKHRDEIIRTKFADDIPTATHELGHYLDKQLGLAHGAYDSELQMLGYETSGVDYTPEQVRKEGVAEAIRLYLTDREKALKEAPKFIKYLEDRIKAEPKIKAALEKIHSETKLWSEQGHEKRIDSTISVGEKGKNENEALTWRGFLENPKRTLDEIYTQVIDELLPFKRAVEGAVKHGAKLLDEDNPYKMAWVARGWKGVADTFLHKDFLDKNGVKIGESLDSILQEVGEINLPGFRRYMVAKHASELVQYDKNVPQEVRDIVKELNPENYKKYEESFKKLVKYQGNLLDLLVDSGRISKESRNYLREKYPSYVPFMREFDSEAHLSEYIQNKGYANLASPIKTMTKEGSTLPVKDPIESIIKNTYLITASAEKNKVGRALLNLAEKSKGYGRVIEGSSDPELALTGRNSSKDTVLTVYKNGKAVKLELQEDLYRAALSLDSESTDILVKLLRPAAAMLRAGATLNPDFPIRNLLRDQFSAAVYSKYGLVPFIDPLKAMFDVYHKTDLYWDWMRSGGAQSSMVSLDRNYLQNTIRKTLKQDGIKSPLDLGKRGMDALRAFSELMEQGTRVAEFKKGIESGASRTDAAIASRDITIDFARIGAKAKGYNSVTAFANAAMQGNDKIRRAWKEDPQGFVTKAVLAITLPSVLLHLYNQDDPRYQELPQYQKDLFWIIPTKERLIKIPKPFELGILFGTMPERVMDYMKNKDPQAFKGLAETVLKNGVPSFLPTGLTPWIENTVNYDFFRERSIVPQREQYEPKEMQTGPYQSRLANAIGNNPVYKISPRKVEHTISALTGGLGTTAMRLPEISKGEVAKGIPAKPEDQPILKGFLARPYINPQSETDFYAKLQELEVAYKRSGVKGNPPTELSSARKVADKLSALRKKQREATADPKLSNKERRAKVDDFNMQMLNVTRQSLGKKPVN